MQTTELRLLISPQACSHPFTHSPNLLPLWNAVSLVLYVFAQLAQVHLSLQGHLKAACVHHFQLQPQALEIYGGRRENSSQLIDGLVWIRPGTALRQVAQTCYCQVSLVEAKGTDNPIRLRLRQETMVCFKGRHNKLCTEINEIMS